MKGLTKRQREVLDFIKTFLENNRYPPTIREVADNFNISVKGSYDHIKALEKKKYIRCNENRSRSIEILQQDEKKDKNLHLVPILGNVSAGRPLFAEENMDGLIEVPTWCVKNAKHFALNVKGDSMQDVGIIHGDIAIVTQQNVAENGDIIVAMLDEAFTIKRFYREKNRIMLKAENPAYPPIYSQDIRILGKVKCIIRNYD